MNLLTKITTAKTGTLLVLALTLSVWTALIPWISVAIGDLSNWLLSVVVSSGPYRLADKKLFDLLENIYHAWWGIGVPFFYVLNAVQFIADGIMSFFLIRALSRRWKDGTARLWQLIVPMILLVSATAFTTVVLYLSYIEVSTWRGESEQVVPVGDEVLMDTILS